jgi:hypothetical protein
MRENVLGKTTRCAEDEGEAAGSYSRAKRRGRRQTAKPKEAAHRDVDYSRTLISGTRGVKNGVKRCPKRRLLHRVDHVTVSRFFLACAVKCHEFCSPPNSLMA